MTAKKKKDFNKKLEAKSIGELQKMLEKQKDERLELRMKNAVRSLKKTHLIREKRKDIARIETVLTAKKTQENGNHRR